MWDTTLYLGLGLPRLQSELTSLLVGILFGAATLLLLVTRTLKGRLHPSPPCEEVLERAERTNCQNGHENAGFLSRRAAFSPLQAPKTSLPAAYVDWDKTAAALPRLIQRGTLRKTLDAMPVLDATSSKKLPDHYLQRASTILGIMSHAYVRLEGAHSLTKKCASHDEVLPEALYAPWAQVSRRLGRTSAQPSLSYIDLIVYNFRTPQYSPEDLTLEELKLLVPTVDNQEERTFYGTMIEINSKVVPILHQVIESQRAVVRNDPAALKRSLRSMPALIRAVTRSLHKISMNPASASYVDPVVWTKTVANLAIPWLDVIGAAGTAHPFFHMMDEFTGRTNYTSKIGKEALMVRASYPVFWREFLKALGQVSVRDFITHTNARDQPTLESLWTAVEDAYAGNWGLLGIHRRKVFGFLTVSFRIGRNSTINGLGRNRQRNHWTEADDELEKARRERRVLDATAAQAGDANHRAASDIFHFSDVIQHNTGAQGYWFTSGDDVYDGQGFLDKHPGGKQVIALCSGQDATRDLAAVGHLSEPRIRAVLERYRIGTLRRRIFAAPALQELYDEAAYLGQRVAETENIVRTNCTFLEAPPTTARDGADELTAPKLHHTLTAKATIREEHAPGLARQVDALLTLLDTTDSGDTRQARVILASMPPHPQPTTPEATPKLANCAAAQCWLQQDLGCLRAMNGRMAALLRCLEKPSFDSACLDAATVGAVMYQILAVADGIRLLGSD